MTLDDLIRNEEIRRLTVDYGYFLDNGRIDALAELFTEDAVFDQRPTGLDVVSRGRDEIRAMMTAVYEQFEGTIHYCTNHRVDAVDGDTATGTCYFQAVSLLKVGARTEYLGRYEDTYRRTSAGWRFAARILVPQLPVVNEGFALEQS